MKFLYFLFCSKKPEMILAWPLESYVELQTINTFRTQFVIIFMIGYVVNVPLIIINMSFLIQICHKLRLNLVCAIVFYLNNFLVH